VLGRLGLAGRLIAIVLLLGLALVTFAVGLGVLLRDQQEAGASRFPVPEQAAAIVALLDRTPESEHAQLLRAIGSAQLRVSVEERPPEPGHPADRMPALEWLIADFLDDPNREVRVIRQPPPGMRTLARYLDRLSAVSRTPVAIGIELASGRYAILEVRGRPSASLWGIPAGFWIGVIGFLLSALAVWAIVREARPLRELARAAESFAGNGRPQPVVPRGAQEVRGLVAAFNAMQGRIAALIEGRNVLLGAVSHDMRTLLTRLRLRVEQIPDAESRNKAIRDVEDMTAMMDDALAVARSTAASGRRQPLDLRELARDTFSDRDPAKVVLRPGGAAWLDGDPVALRRALVNLVDNALAYGSRCEVALDRCKDGVTLSVEDDGPGIPEESRVLVLEPFTRLETSRNRTTGGSGLGLAVVKAIAEAHGGTIAVGASTQLGGARIVLTLAGGHP
jgi:signal transduction histidine kinase